MTERPIKRNAIETEGDWRNKLQTMEINDPYISIESICYWDVQIYYTGPMYVFYQIENQSKIIHVDFSIAIKLLIGVTDFNQIDCILKLWSCSRQPVEYRVPPILNSCKNYLPKS